MARAILVLIVSEHEWASRALDTVLGPKGYAVLRAYNVAQAVERAAGSRPDAVLIERSLPDGDGIELCRALREEHAVDATTPLIVTTSGPVTKEQRLSALRAGAWEIVTLPLDAEELILRIDRYTRAKREADRIRNERLLDPDTGFYSRYGIVQRAGEVIAAAKRYGRPVACIVFEAHESANGDSGAEMAKRLADVLRASTRKSDILGRVGPSQFAILAPDTPEQGAEVVAARLRESATGDDPVAGARAGFFGVNNVRDLDLDPGELLARALAGSGGSHLN